MMNAAEPKSRLRIVDTLFVGWTMLAYRDFDSWAMHVAVGMISSATTINTYGILAILGANELFPVQFGYFAQVALFALFCGALYFRYLRDRNVSQQIIECYVRTGRLRYAKAIAILYFLTIPIPMAIYLVLTQE
jgi:hypothetical protein